ncbi:LysM peptidoglycan-binding domain-containing protein [Usitatibacter palustris]|uniref:LysM peptidoglycan-binding domain-containing protein n=1 Tax=Usitatibacter palustris TaxID=2732487 RepID=UPI00148856CD|nr:LysM peptidoglycan-binding domain-containing protein [Usitatibacter palustris]
MVKGDTLWHISGRFLKEPFKWPLLWQMNREQIKNPHLIYPGDIIKLDRSGAYPELSIVSGGSGGEGGASGGTAEQAAGNVVRLEPRTRIAALGVAVPSIPGAAIGPFLTQPMVVEANGLDTAPAIVATEESRILVGAGSIAYADRIASTDGVNWQVFRRGRELTDPDTGELLGYEARYVGDARVRRYGDPTTLEITKAREEINRGDRLLPARETSFPSYIPRAPDKPIKGSIMSVDGGVSELGQYQIVTLNRGSRDGIEVGHVLASFRRGDVITGSGQVIDTWQTDLLGGLRSWWYENMETKAEEKADAKEASGESKKGGAVLEGTVLKIPDERNGLVFVFRVFEKMSYAMVMRSTKPIYVGDVVQTP